MTVVGIDPSLTSSGIAILSNDSSPYTFALTTTPKDGTDICRILSQLRRLRNILSGYPAPFYFFMEDYGFGVGRNTKFASSRLATMGEVGGLYKAFALNMTGKDLTRIPIGTWKFFLCSNGRLKPEDFKLAVFKKFNIDCKTVDEAAALAIADYGYCIVNGTAFNNRIFTKYEKKKLNAHVDTFSS